MSTNCHRCEIAAECAALPHGVLDCQDNAARFDAEPLPPCPWTFRGSIDCAQYGPRDCDGVRCAGQTPAEETTPSDDRNIDPDAAAEAAALREAARAVLDAWESGDLAGAVRGLADTLENYPEPRPFEDCDKPCSVECDRMTCTRDDETEAE